jgi:hypothetical protein
MSDEPSNWFHGAQVSLSPEFEERVLPQGGLGWVPIVLVVWESRSDRQRGKSVWRIASSCILAREGSNSDAFCFK